MTREQLLEAIVQTLARIAPEVDARTLDAARPLREQVDLDSVDWMNFLVALGRRLGVPIGAADATQLTTLEKLLDYLAARLPRG
jgi:acyl carrier protein